MRRALPKKTKQMILISELKRTIQSQTKQIKTLQEQVDKDAIAIKRLQKQIIGDEQLKHREFTFTDLIECARAKGGF